MATLTDAEYMAYMFKYDSVHRVWPGKVEGAADGLIIDGKKIKGFAMRCAIALS